MLNREHDKSALIRFQKGLAHSITSPKNIGGPYATEICDLILRLCIQMSASAAADLDRRLSSIREEGRKLRGDLRGDALQFRREETAAQRKALEAISAHLSRLGARAGDLGEPRRERRMESLRSDQAGVAKAIADLAER